MGLSVLLTGVSSFTGSWFARRLADDGHRVTGTLQRRVGDYLGLESRRIATVRAAGVALVEGASYGNPVMQDLVSQGFDRICFHGSDLRDFRSETFDVARAVAANTAGLDAACRLASAAGTRRLIWTATVFEPHASRGDRVSEAVTPYGESKWLSWQVAQRTAAARGLEIGRFIVPNPFGPLEQDRFCTYLVNTWLDNESPVVRTPKYVRDNIPVDRLARAYADFVALEPGVPRASQCGPSGYVESQAQFTARFAREIGPRLGLEAPFLLAEQTDFSEPLTRIGLGDGEVAWDETRFWDSLAADYAERLDKRAK